MATAKIIVANWKNHPDTLEEARELFKAEILAAEQNANVQTVICPPFIFLEALSESLRTVNYKLKTILGAQDLEDKAERLKNWGVSYVLAGHSDRRYSLGETDELINQKIKSALAVGITPVLLVGEKEKDGNREEVLVKQLRQDLEGLSAKEVSKILIAYEPVWAISTNSGGRADTSENALAAIKIINSFLIDCEPVINHYLYGGSVNQNNVADFLKYPEIGGAIVGAASLRSEEFNNILKITAGICEND